MDISDAGGEPQPVLWPFQPPHSFLSRLPPKYWSLLSEFLSGSDLVCLFSLGNRVLRVSLLHTPLTFHISFTMNMAFPPSLRELTTLQTLRLMTPTENFSDTRRMPLVSSSEYLLPCLGDLEVVELKFGNCLEVMRGWALGPGHFFGRLGKLSLLSSETYPIPLQSRLGTVNWIAKLPWTLTVLELSVETIQGIKEFYDLPLRLERLRIHTHPIKQTTHTLEPISIDWLTRLADLRHLTISGPSNLAFRDTFAFPPELLQLHLPTTFSHPPMPDHCRNLLARLPPSLTILHAAPFADSTQCRWWSNLVLWIVNMKFDMDSFEHPPKALMRSE